MDTSSFLLLPNYLLSCPQWKRLQDGRRKELHAPHFVRESSVHELHILLPVEKATSNCHVCTWNHVVLDQSCQRLPILQIKTHKKRKKGQTLSHTLIPNHLPGSHLSARAFPYIPYCPMHTHTRPFLGNKLPPKSRDRVTTGFYFCHLPTVLGLTALHSSSSLSLLCLVPSGSSYFCRFLAFMHKFGLAAVSCVLVFILWFYALVFFTHLWPGSPVNQSSIQQIFIESLLYA